MIEPDPSPIQLQTPPDQPSSQELTLTLRSRITEVMAVDQVQAEPSSNAIMFLGKLRIKSDQAFEQMSTRLKEIGYFPLLRDLDNDAERQVFVVIKGDAIASVDQRPWMSLGLFVATLISTAFAGTLFSRAVANVGSDAALNALSLLDVVTYGLPFALTLLSILGVHELGHYVAARWHKLPVTLPFFIPMPIGLGTLGAFIQMRGMPRSKRALFDVGLAGPVAGLLIAIPLYVVGLLIAQVLPDSAPSNRAMLMDFLIAIFRPDAVNHGILFNPVLYAARIGLVITMLNLLPVGQLDGGHIAYAALGRHWARWIAMATMAIMAVLGFMYSPNWFIWLLFAGLGGAARHASPMDDVTPLDFMRLGLFLLTVILFLALFTSRPF
ncbi:MAG: site-2 protease family protein [Chloroflexota bacterium]|jgi:membrane-associated protease RseP (regulator of RpoE activity)|nr:site-2 protease family protein [Chloroflexota bacterium]